MRTHPVHSEEIVQRIASLRDSAPGVRHHHERYDGAGYPDGIAGEEIPLIARIVCCCDAFNAMTTDRSYRKALPLHEAIAELQRTSGTQFDPKVVDALIATVERVPAAA